MAEGARFGRNALLLWAAQFISAAGDALFLPCLTWLAASTGDGDGAVGLLYHPADPLWRFPAPAHGHQRADHVAHHLL